MPRLIHNKFRLLGDGRLVKTSSWGSPLARRWEPEVSQNRSSVNSPIEGDAIALIKALRGFG